jgi:outer membrane scaffolding protein for murein synthesis (MipA/OmpV family)
VRFAGAIGLLAVLGAEPLLAQVVAPGVPTTTQGSRVPQQRDWQIGVGFAPIYSPVWQGSRDYSLSLFPDVRLNYRDLLFFSVPDGLGWNAVNKGGWKIGPLFKFRFGRNEGDGGSPFLITGGSDALIGMGDIGFAGEPGAFVQYGFAGRKARARAEVRKGFGGHEGLVADTSISWSDRIGTPGAGGSTVGGPGRIWLYSLSARATFAGADYTNAYFGVDATQAAATGLAPFRTGDGLVSTGVNASLTKLVGRQGRYGAVTLFGGYDRLADVVAESTLITERGKRDQFSLGLSYGFRVGFGPKTSQP